MNVKTIISIVGALFLMLTVSGCSYNGSKVKPRYISDVSGYKDTPTYDGKPIILIAAAAPGAPSMSRASDATDGAWYAMQRAAEVTLDRGDLFFAIQRPKLVSNTDGSTMNTPEEFAKKCTNSSLASVASAIDAFGFGDYGCHMYTTQYKKSGFLTMVTYSEKPKNILVYDAKYLISFLKKNDLYVEDEDTRERSKVRGLGDWYQNLKEKN